jgi:two-component system phosphate regulon sensor histidine kinase PhoR
MVAMARVGNAFISASPVLLAITGVVALGSASFVPVPLFVKVLLVGLGAVCVAAGLVVGYAVQVQMQCRATAYLDALSRMECTELLASDLDRALPRPVEHHACGMVLRRVRNAMVRLAEKLQAADQARAAGEVRLRAVQLDHEQMRAILDSIPVPVLGVNGFGELTLANVAAAELFELPALTEGRVAFDTCIGVPALQELVADIARRKSPAQRAVEFELTLRDGTRRNFRAVSRYLAGSGELAQTARVVVILTDVSDHKATQKRHAEFVSAVSHEMKTPLAGIRAYVELLADGEAEDEATRDEFLSIINSQVDRLQRLIDNLLNLARIEAGVVEVHKRLLSANEVLQEAFHVVQPAAQQKQIDYRCELSSMHLAVHADRDMLLQAAINLLSNAVKYTPEHGQVILRSRLHDGWVEFEVQDTGVGLSPEDAEKIFQKFYRVKKDSKMASGTGLGLPLAKHIIEEVHGGTIRVESQLGKGSIFRVSLPTGRAER